MLDITLPGGFAYSLRRKLLLGTGLVLTTSFPPLPALLVVQGDSIPNGYGTTGGVSLPSWDTQTASNGAYPVRYANEKLGLQQFQGLTVSGTTLSNVISQLTTVQGFVSTLYGLWAPSKIVTISIGSNDRGTAGYYPSGAASFVSDLFAYTDQLRASGYKVLFATILPISAAQLTNTATNVTTFDTWRAAIKAGVIAGIGTHIDGVIRLDEEPIMGLQSTVEATTYYQDGLHPTDAGHILLEAVYSAAVHLFSPGIAQPAAYTAWNPSDKASNVVLTNSNYSAGCSNTSFGMVRSNNYHYYGKVYTETKLTGSTSCVYGLVDKRSALAGNFPGAGNISIGLYQQGGMFPAGFTAVNAPNPVSFVVGTTANWAIDFDAGKLWIGLNGVYPAGGDPVAGTNPSYTFPPNTPLFMGTGANDTSAVVTLPSSSGSLTGTIPSGFVAF